MSKIQSLKSPSLIAMDPLAKVKRSDFERTSFFAKQFCLPKEIKLV